jgi:hypothetical protein
MRNRISVEIPGHGLFRTTPAGLDRTMKQYLPASPEQLRRIVEEVNPESSYADVQTVSELLMILADAYYPNAEWVPAECAWSWTAARSRSMYRPPDSRPRRQRRTE